MNDEWERREVAEMIKKIRAIATFFPFFLQSKVKKRCIRLVLHTKDFNHELSSCRQQCGGGESVASR